MVTNVCVIFITIHKWFQMFVWYLLQFIHPVAASLQQHVSHVFSMISWSNWTPNDSFGICSSWGFQNCPWSLNLMKFWLRYLRLKTIESISKISFSSTFIDSLEMELCLQPWITQSILHQIQRSGTVLESACHEDSETVIDF